MDPMVYPPRSRDDVSIKHYLDEAGKHRWRITHKSNGEIVGAASQGYSELRDSKLNLYLITGWEADEES